jgi:diacylglycerol kinase (ATP)
MEKILFIVNPVSGRGNGKRLAEVIIKKIGSSGAPVMPVILFTGGKNEVRKIIAAGLKEGIRKFVAVGGDGTVNEVASALVHTDGIMGIIPNGSGNGLARHLNIPRKVSSSLRVVLEGDVRKIDYGLLDKQAFFCVSGVGFDARIGDVYACEKGRGFITYAKAAMKEYFKYKPQNYRLVIDGKRVVKVRALLITFANASQYGNNAFIAPRADVSDGLMDVCILRPFPLFSSPGIIYALFGKRLDRSRMLETIRCREVELKQQNPGSVHYDGEPGKAGKKVRVRLVEHGLRVLIPAVTK